MVQSVRSICLAGIWILITAATPPPKITLAPPPQIPNERIGDWTVAHIGGDVFFATTKNNSGATFGSMCNAGGCAVFFNPTITCEEGHKYPALINAPSSAFSVVLGCEKLDGLLFYALPLDEAMTDAMSVGGVIGVAFPMQSGEFKVARFSLTGAARATARAGQLAKGPRPNPQQPASDNYTM